jgi:hypothetical protein
VLGSRRRTSASSPELRCRDPVDRACRRLNELNKKIGQLVGKKKGANVRAGAGAQQRGAAHLRRAALLITPGACREIIDAWSEKCPRQESNLRTRFRKPLYPL